MRTRGKSDFLKGDQVMALEADLRTYIKDMQKDDVPLWEFGAYDINLENQASSTQNQRLKLLTCSTANASGSCCYTTCLRQR